VPKSSGRAELRYLLDTDICIYVINERPAQVVAQFLAHEDEGIGISAITAAELQFGVRKSGSQRNVRALDAFLAPLTIFDFDAAAAQAYGEIRTALERKGVPIGPLDTQIAAHALALGMTLVTNNVREFKRVPGLRVENWAD
jgi:tRNA(fMet)-specific endonuclease VapC